jgi:prolyl-tRNA synthetase
MSTRMIGGIIMVHGDDDGLRVPPRLAPWQVVIVPMLRDSDEDAALLDYCEGLKAELVKLSAFGEPVRVLLDTRAAKAANKRWGWVKKGAPVVIEVGGRDMAGGNVSMIRRDRLYREDGKLDSAILAKGDFVAQAAGLLEEIQTALHSQARAKLDANIVRGVDSFDALKAHFEGSGKYPGWVEVQWAKPTDEELDKAVELIKALKLTFRNVPLDAAPADGTCMFTGRPAVERILVARAY